MKTCTQCGLVKELELFGSYKYKNEERRRAACTDCRNVRQKARYRENPEIHRAYLLKQKYSMTLEDYDQMIVDQGGKCKICGTETPNCHHKRFVVDHNHATNEVRGLLCSTCNTGLGNFSDNPEIILKAAQYLYTHGYYG